MPNDPPWQGKTPTECGHDEPHDPATCEICGPPMRTEAWRRGVIRAGQEQTHLPMSSREPEAKPGRDGYELTTTERTT